MQNCLADELQGVAVRLLRHWGEEGGGGAQEHGAERGIEDVLGRCDERPEAVGGEVLVAHRLQGEALHRVAEVLVLDDVDPVALDGGVGQEMVYQGHGVLQAKERCRWWSIDSLRIVTFAWLDFSPVQIRARRQFS